MFQTAQVATRLTLVNGGGHTTYFVPGYAIRYSPLSGRAITVNAASAPNAGASSGECGMNESFVDSLPVELHAGRDENLLKAARAGEVA